MRFDLRLNRANGLFGLLVSGFMLLSVACSHTRTASNQLDGLSEEAEISESRSTASAEESESKNPASAEVSADITEKASEEVVEAPKSEAPKVEVPAVVEAPVTPESNDLVAMAEADLKAIGESQENSAPSAISAPVTTVRAHPFKSKGKPQKENSDLAEFTDLVAKSIQMPPEEPVEEPKPQLASSDLSQAIERNLVWLVGLLTIGALWVFVLARRNRRSRFNSPF